MSSFITVYDFVEEKILPSNQGVEADPSWSKNEAKTIVSEQFENSIREVNKKELIVREGKSKNSRISGILNKGYIVQIIEKKRNWTYIMYSDPEESVVIEGWTNTRYLKRINE